MRGRRICFVRNLKRMHRLWILLLCLASLLAVASSDELHPTPWWVDFLGEEESTLDSELLPVGAVIRAYDPTGVLAGRAEVSLAGWYLVSVYADDPMTTELDEGAVSGDPIAFTVDDNPAVPLGPDLPVWSQTGTLAHVELRACTLAGDFDCDCRVTVADLMRQARSFGASRGQAGYYPPYDHDEDEDIDIGDLQETAGRWHTGCQG
ncbi:MAG: hypothetical protein ACE5LU_20680 [Anaerolineae bacterium]